MIVGPNRGSDAPFRDAITTRVRLREEVVGGDDSVSAQAVVGKCNCCSIGGIRK